MANNEKFNLTAFSPATCNQIIEEIIKMYSLKELVLLDKRLRDEYKAYKKNDE
jgi:hypothetical protein